MGGCSADGCALLPTSAACPSINREEVLQTRAKRSRSPSKTTWMCEDEAGGPQGGGRVEGADIQPDPEPHLYRRQLKRKELYSDGKPAPGERKKHSNDSKGGKKNKMVGRNGSISRSLEELLILQTGNTTHIHKKTRSEPPSTMTSHVGKKNLWDLLEHISKRGHNRFSKSINSPPPLTA